jgi:hypothetical protein
VPDRDSRRLLRYFGELPRAQRQALLEYAEFLHTRHGAGPSAAEPLDISRPESESVVGALKRLRSTYPMLDAQQLLTDTSELMSQHLTGGRGAIEVIDELEIVFRRHYESHAESRAAARDDSSPTDG